MKIWIVGEQGTEKHVISSLLADDHFKVGRLFTTYKGQLIHPERYNVYSQTDIEMIFENGAYIFMTNYVGRDGEDYVEGLSLDEYDSNTVFIVSIDNFININSKYISKDDLVVWLDGKESWRQSNCSHNDIPTGIFELKNKLEKSQEEAFFAMITNINNTYKNMIYFFEEVPERVKTIIKTIYNNPKLKSEFVKNFN